MLQLIRALLASVRTVYSFLLLFFSPHGQPCTSEPGVVRLVAIAVGAPPVAEQAPGHCY